MGSRALEELPQLNQHQVSRDRHQVNLELFNMLLQRQNLLTLNRIQLELLLLNLDQSGLLQLLSQDWIQELNSRNLALLNLD